MKSVLTITEKNARILEPLIIQNYSQSACTESDILSLYVGWISFQKCRFWIPISKYHNQGLCSCCNQFIDEVVSLLKLSSPVFTEQVYKHSLVEEGEDADLYNIEVMDTAGSIEDVGAHQ